MPTVVFLLSIFINTLSLASDVIYCFLNSLTPLTSYYIESQLLCLLSFLIDCPCFAIVLNY